MKSLFCSLALALFSFASLSAQTAKPAQPVDPDQARPAQPVTLPDSLTPDLAAPPAAPATNNASAAAAPGKAQNSLGIIADSSLKLVLQELAQSWADSQDSGPQVPLTLTNAGTLRSKVESEGTWDVIISADIDDMKEMTSRGAVQSDGQRSVARNTLVVYGRKALVKDDELDWFDLIGTEWQKIALGNPDLVASGRVAQHALQKHGLADDDHKSLYTYALTETLALGVAQREQADAVFIYKTDVARANLRGFDVFPLTTVDAPPVFYIAGVSSQSRNPAQAQAFVDFCGSDAAKTIWTKYGFETN